ncbi:MAG TPA: xanthine dehydrogenase family protein molybdopterin-binding subunit [Solirubrobacteraceae bacterium]|nr:xanthine dehydrogenase family protein molybdopterin-binding subunit [Solirubrobacteraceae bacterium]
MSNAIATRTLGADVGRRDGPRKVTGAATYAYEHPLTDPAYVVPLLSTVARGRVVGIDAAEARRLPGVLAVLTHEPAPELADTSNPELAILQSPAIHFRGQIVGAVIAESLEIGAHAAALVRIEEQASDHDVVLRVDHPDVFKPDDDGTDTAHGDAEAGLRAAATTVDATYTTPQQHQGAMEPHTSVALWRDDALRLYESTQSVHGVRETIMEVFGLRAEQVEVTAPFVGGGFGSKGEVHANTVLAVIAARAVPGRAVKLALTRHHVFTLGSHRTPTIQRVRLGADASGGLLAITHDVWAHTSRMKAYIDQVAAATRMMYAAPSIATTHRLVPLDVPFPSWMRAPSETPGMYALECAIDELAIALRIDPIELRIRNDPPADPDSGKPWSSRNLVACLRQGAERFGWARRDPAPRRRRDGRWLAGTGVAGSTYPVFHTPGSQAQIEFRDDGRYEVSIGAIDVGTGTWTSLSQIAAEALGVPHERVALQIGDTALPYSHVPGGSAGITSWGATLFGAARAFRDRHGDDPAPGDTVTAGAPDNPAEDAYAMHAFGTHFAEVRVDADTGEVRVPRMLGMFAIGRVVNPRTARSQLIGGMTFGLSMALHEEVVMDAALGAIVTPDLAGYHIATNADVGDIDAAWIDEIDPHVNPMGTKGIGELGIVGAAAAIANAVFHATGTRMRDLPITPDKLLRAHMALGA